MEDSDGRGRSCIAFIVPSTSRRFTSCGSVRIQHLRCTWACNCPTSILKHGACRQGLTFRRGFDSLNPRTVGFQKGSLNVGPRCALAPIAMKRRRTRRSDGEETCVYRRRSAGSLGCEGMKNKRGQGEEERHGTQPTDVVEVAGNSQTRLEGNKHIPGTKSSDRWMEQVRHLQCLRVERRTMESISMCID